MNKRTKYLQIRLTPEEALQLRGKAATHGSVSHFIRCAVAEYSDVNAKQRLELINDLVKFYVKYRDELSWAGGNLNQAMKRINELAIAGKLTPYHIENFLMPTIESTRDTMTKIKQELEKVTLKATKL